MVVVGTLLVDEVAVVAVMDDVGAFNFNIFCTCCCCCCCDDDDDDCDDCCR